MWETKDMRNFLTFAAFAAATAFTAPAFAQTAPAPAPASLPSSDNDTIEASALLIQPATIQGIEDLSFGTIIATATASGNVTISPSDGSRTLAAGLTGSSVDVGQRGRFLGNGLPTQEVRISAVFPDFLANEDNLTDTVEFVGSLDSNVVNGSLVIGNTGVFYIGVGGTITIDAGQAPGRYSGDVKVTADFQ
jgi:hypothetical protein